MAQGKSFFDDVKKEIECPVCQEQFSETKDPKILKCFHTFCKSCLEGWLRQQGGGALSCPTCRQITECPNKNINSLPSNLFYKQMVDIVTAYSGQGQEDSPHCGNCDERKTLKFYCSDCNYFLCEECAGLHTKWKDFRGHHVKEIRNFESSDVQDFARRSNVCEQHKDEFRFFCEPCKICICRDCAILNHEDHKKITLEKGLENKKSALEAKMKEVQANRSRLRSQKESLEKRRVKVNNSFEQATKEVHKVAERCKNLISQHEASVTEQLIKQKGTFQVSFVNEMTRLDGKLSEIDNSLEFGQKVVSRNNLPEILNVEKMLEKRLQELANHFEPMQNFTEVRYIPNDVSSLINVPGKLTMTNTEPSMSIAEGQGLTKALRGEKRTFTVITRDLKSQTTYSEIDQINVEINSLTAKGTLRTSVTDLKNGHYQVMYTSDAVGDFNVSITVGGEAIKGSPFRLTVAEKITGLNFSARVFGRHNYRFQNCLLESTSESSRPTQCTVEVYGLPPGASEDLVTNYFENPRRSKGGPVSAVVMETDFQRCLVTFESPDDAIRTSEHSPHILSGARLQVSLFEEFEDENPDDDEKNIQEEDSCTDGDDITIIVSGISPSTTENAVINYFEHSRRSGGGDVSSIDYDNDGETIITFLEVKDLERLLEQPHKLDGKTITVARQPPKKKLPLDPIRIHVQGLCETTTEDHLRFYLEKYSDVEVEEVVFGPNNNALATFEAEPDFESLLHKVGKDRKGIEGKKPRLERVPVCSCILVTGLKKETTDDTIELHFENEKRSGGKDVSEVERKGKDQALVYFEDPSSVNNVMLKSQAQGHILEGNKLVVKPHYPFLEGPATRKMEVRFNPDVFDYTVNRKDMFKSQKWGRFRE